jgi:hypothetical protein
LFVVIIGVTCAGFWIADSYRSRRADWRKEVVVGKLNDGDEDRADLQIEDVQLESKDIDTYVGTGRLKNGQVFEITATFNKDRLEIEKTFPKIADSIIGTWYRVGTTGGLSSYSMDWTVTHPRFMQVIRILAISVACNGVALALLGIFRVRRRFAPRIEVGICLIGILNLGCLYVFISEFITHL